MAELNTGGGGGGHKDGKVRSKKQSTRVDLTAMVDLAFLLITFFMLTTTLLKPQAMDLFMPDKEKEQDEQLDFADDRTMTVLLGSDDRLAWYMGTVDKPKTPTVDNYGANGIRKAILEKKKEVAEIYKDDPKKASLLVLIKPSDKSNYKNLVDILDEMKISDVQTYAIVDITTQEIEGLLKRENIYN